MATISVPLSTRHQKYLDDLVARSVGSSRADVMRKALAKLAEDDAIAIVLEAEREMSFGKGMRGDLRKLAQQFP